MDAIADFFSRRSKVMLQLSAGKDSAACLYLLEEYWPKLTVLWCDTGDAYPETIAYMQRIAAMVPHFSVAHGDVRAFIKVNGFPADAVVSDYTAFGQLTTTKKDVPFVAYQVCCNDNLWQPMWKAVLDGGFDGVIRGQKDSDSHRSPTRSGDIHEGVEFLHPVESWTDGDVIAYLGNRLPSSYQRGIKSSLDCLHCTAYVDKARIDDLRDTAPLAHAHVVALHRKLGRQLREAAQAYIWSE